MHKEKWKHFIDREYKGIKTQIPLVKNEAFQIIDDKLILFKLQLEHKNLLFL